jgi:hypothetical protein
LILLPLNLHSTLKQWSSIFKTYINRLRKQVQRL